eukprot:11942418-Alexandrium_andersonii.AAC.1
MSASLVGSEMCIRDSSTTGRPSRASCSTSSQRARSRAWSARGAARRSSCLLYTSDAADDM